MIELEVRPPVVVGEIEWISVAIHGQSFMLHQIVRDLFSLFWYHDSRWDAEKNDQSRNASM
jgi:tRNA U38,U39,U40 pseudouridine synthase TruA